MDGTIVKARVFAAFSSGSGSSCSSDGRFESRASLGALRLATAAVKRRQVGMSTIADCGKRRNWR